MTSGGQVLLAVDGLDVRFPVSGGRDFVHAVQNLSLTVDRGETLGIVGESGSGKSTVAKAVMRLLEPHGGSIRLDGRELTGLGESALRPIRNRVQIVFQDPYSAINPKRRIWWVVTEGSAIRNPGKIDERRRQAAAVLEMVGLDAGFLDRFPHQLSGGQRQRVAIARALAVEPGLLILDEPTSALDVSIQAQILNLLLSLQERLDLAYIVVSHDMAVIRHLCDRVLVMYRGRVVEQGPAGRVLASPGHDYTRKLLAAEPRLD